MRLPRFALFAISLLTVACSAIATAGRSAGGFVRDFIDTIFLAVDPRAVLELLRTDDRSLAFAGASNTAIDPALAFEQRHEAGLATLGAVRHR